MTTATLEQPMAAKKATAKGRTKAEAEKPARKPMIVQVRGSEEYKAWVESMAEAKGFSAAMLVDQALRLWAEKNGQPEAPKR